MTTTARITNVIGIDGGSRVLGRQNGVLAMAIRADRRLHDAALHRLAMNSFAILLRDITVTGAAKIWHRSAKFYCLCTFQFVGRSMAGVAAWRRPITLAYSLPMYAALVITYHVRMAGDTSGLGNAFRVGIVLMSGVAVLAGDAAVGVGLDFVRDVAVAGYARFIVDGRLVRGGLPSALGGRAGLREQASRQQYQKNPQQDHGYSGRHFRSTIAAEQPTLVE